MATFVTIEPDAFNQNFSTMAEALRRQATTDASERALRREALYHGVRRPVRGIQVKDDTYALLQVRDSAGVNLPLFDAAAAGDVGKGNLNSNFLIQSITEQRAEKQQVVLTFGEPYIFFFGEQPRSISVSGVLLNTEDFNWRAEWWENYDRYLRGTQCVRSRTRVYLSWDDIFVEGYITQAGAAESTDNRSLVQFNFELFLTNYQNISSIGDPNSHWNTKEISLDPNSIDLPGEGGRSTTLDVRGTNLLSESLESGRGANSLLDFLTSGDITGAASRLVSLQGQLVDFLDLAGQFVSGRNIRVPIGFEGAAAFDSDVQIALASIPGADDVIAGNTESRSISLQTGGLNVVKEFRAVLGSKFGPARVGLPLSANEDEFIARVSVDTFGVSNLPNLDSSQVADIDDGTQKVRDIFALFGINTDPPSELSLLLKRGVFGIVSIGAGIGLSKAPKLRSGLNITGTLL